MRRRRIEASPNARDGVFQNPVPTGLMKGVPVVEMMKRMRGKERRVPPGPLPIYTSSLRQLQAAPSGRVGVTWLGHSTLLVEIEGTRLLTDPVFSERASPVQWAGPKRFHPPPIALEQLPRLDAIVISHDHYDHLDHAAVTRLAQLSDAPFITSLGLGEHLEKWGIDPDRIFELDWHETKVVESVTITATPARHFSGRLPFARNRTLWSSWVLAGERHRVFFTGDTGFFEGLADIGAVHGPFDVALVKIAAYSDLWPDIHLEPEDSVRVSQLVRGARMLPIHWGTFNLAFHAWDEPIERAVAAAQKAGVELLTPRIGEPVDPLASAGYPAWWRDVK